MQKNSYPRFPGPRSPRPSFGPPRPPFFRTPRGPFGPPGPPSLTPPRPGNFPPRSPYRSRPPFLHSLSVTSSSSNSPPVYHSTSEVGGPGTFPFPGIRKSSFDRPSANDRMEDEFRLISPSPPTTPPSSDLFPRIHLPPLQHVKNKLQPQQPPPLQQQQQQQQQLQQQRKSSFDKELQQYKTDSNFSLTQPLVIISGKMVF